MPGLDLTEEWNDYVSHRRENGRPATIENFVERWLPRAQRRFGKISRPKQKPSLLDEISAIEQLPIEDVEPEKLNRFLREFEDRKERKIESESASRAVQ